MGLATATVSTRPPTLGRLLLGSGPRFLRDAFGPTVVFYVGWKLVGLLAGVIVATLWTAAAYTWERRHARPGVAARIGLGIALVQAVAGLASQSPIGYFAPPVIINAAYGLAFLISVAIGRPLAGVFAVESYPVPAEIRALPAVRRTFTTISLVWGIYLLFRSALRLVVLLRFSVDVYVAVNVLTAAPMTVGLMTWSFWYGLRGIRRAVAPSEAGSGQATSA
jgi:intracellular septation protein A